MTRLNYDEISRIYDDVRSADVELLSLFLEEVNVQEDTKVLDVGCGTGNYTSLLQRVTNAQVYGVDASQGMIDKAREKSENVQYFVADVLRLPFCSDFFAFIYMTDVIHHIPDIQIMFCELNRVLAPCGKLCIATQSHRQIDRRYVSEFFPATAKVDKRRYPAIKDIVQAGQAAGLSHVKSTVYAENKPVTLGSDFLELVEKKGYSMFHLISDEDYQKGCRSLKEALSGGSIVRHEAGGTLVWFVKK